MAESDFSRPCIIGYGSFPMRTGGCCQTVDHEISRFPRKKRLHMPGSLTTPGRPNARDDVLPSTIYTVSAPRIGNFRAQWLAYALPCQRFAEALAGNRA